MDNSFYEHEIALLEQSDNKRILPSIDLSLLENFSSNDYLGIANDQAFRDDFFASIDIKKLSFASASSRLLTGNHTYYYKIERLIAESFSREACLFYNSGIMLILVYYLLWPLRAIL